MNLNRPNITYRGFLIVIEHYQGWLSRTRSDRIYQTKKERVWFVKRTFVRAEPSKGKYLYAYWEFSKFMKVTTATKSAIIESDSSTKVKLVNQMKHYIDQWISTLSFTERAMYNVGLDQQGELFTKEASK